MHAAVLELTCHTARTRQQLASHAAAPVPWQLHGLSAGTQPHCRRSSVTWLCSHQSCAGSNEAVQDDNGHRKQSCLSPVFALSQMPNTRHACHALSTLCCVPSVTCFHFCKLYTACIHIHMLVPQKSATGPIHNSLDAKVPADLCELLCSIICAEQVHAATHVSPCCELCVPR
jgi:hypothetical protein